MISLCVSSSPAGRDLPVIEIWHRGNGTMASVLDEAPAEARPSSKPRPVALGGPFLHGIVVGVGVVLAISAGDALFGRNLHAVIDSRVYRSAQLSPGDLRKAIDSYGIRTVLNLRGCSAPLPWYMDECRVTQERAVSEEDV